MSELDGIKKTLAETAIRLRRIELYLGLLSEKNVNMKFPTQEEVLDINIKANKEIESEIPWVKWGE